MPTAIVGYNASPGSEDALAFACVLRRTLGYELIVASCAVDAFDRPNGNYTAMLHKAAKDALSSARLAFEDDRDVRFQVVCGTSAGRALHAIADRHEADLIVVGATHHHATAELFAPSITHQTIQAAPCAVAVAPAGFRDREHPQLRKLVVAFDDSPEAFEALRHAADVARRTGAHIKVLYGYDVAIAMAVPSAISYVDPQMIEATRELAQEKVERATAFLVKQAPEIEVSWALLSGVVAHKLVDASERADLVFLGSRSYGPLRRALLGSVSARVVRSARCPVIVTPRVVDHSRRRVQSRDEQHEFTT